MIGIPKPRKRGPKPPRPIARYKRPAFARIRGGLGKLRMLADDFQSLYVRMRDGWTCRVCGSKRWQEMQAAHLFAKGEFHGGRYNEDNVWCLCSRCHRKYTSQPVAWNDYLLWKLGATEAGRIKLSARLHHGPHDYALVAIGYRARVEVRVDRWKVDEMVQKLIARGAKLGAWS